MNNTPSGTQKRRESTELESRQTAITATKLCTSPSLFYRFEVSRGGSNCSLKNYGFLCSAIFFVHMYACAQTN